ncbi:SPI-1 type III secretion system chaperone SpaK [Dryocola sp. BD626]|uniref:InvB/SpaK family type III secretion system chaperone n=1 Tax=Dryocola sp. BD626 TaxID=3133273 RepID=UPI003F50690A
MYKNQDITALLTAALQEAGYHEADLGPLDEQGYIELKLQDMPSINISVENGDVCVWSHLNEYSESYVNYRGAELLLAMLEGCQGVRGGQLYLTRRGESLALTALVHPDFLSHGRSFAQVLDGFFNEFKRFLNLAER